MINDDDRISKIKQITNQQLFDNLKLVKGPNLFKKLSLKKVKIAVT